MKGKSHPYPTCGPAEDEYRRDLAESELANNKKKPQ